MRALMVGIGVLLVVSVTNAAETNPLDDLTASVNNDAASLVALGDLQVAAMRLDAAKRTYKKALRLDRKSGEAQFGLARIQMAKDQFKTAKRACLKIERKFKKKSVGDVCSGQFWLGNGRSARAVEAFDKALQKGDVARGKTGMGDALRIQGKYKEAIATYDEAIAAGAGYLALLGRGLTYEMMGNKSDALKALKKAVDSQPASCLAHYHYGRLQTPGETGIRHLKTALAMRPKWTEASIALGDVYLTMGNAAGAAEAFQNATLGKTARGAAFYGLGRSLHLLGRTKEAAAALKQAIDLIPNYADAYLLVADIQYAAGDEPAAVDALEKARAAAPGDVSVYLHSGEMLFKLGRHTNARSFLGQAISMNPELSKAHALLGQIACDRRLYDAGRTHFQKALDGDLVGVDAKKIRSQQGACKPKK
ncbi:MAG: tetratricopeptide repeat protein [Myxococcota bacterium]|nr:tetratricopeptide repeat protein [Myxococcota bacterium]